MKELTEKECVGVNGGHVQLAYYTSNATFEAYGSIFGGFCKGLWNSLDLW